MNENILISNDNIFVISLPKSGTIYIQKSLSQSTGYYPYYLQDGYFPKPSLKIDNLSINAKYIFSCHNDPSDRILDFINKRDTTFLHVRDPRGALLSWCHHVLRDDIRQNHSKNLGIPESYYAGTFESQINWQIEHRYKEMIWWLTQWANVLKQPELRKKIILTNYLDLQADSDTFIQIMLKHSRIENTSLKLAEKDISSHFRNGNPNEWVDIFNNQQKNKCSLLLGNLSRDFGFIKK